MRHESALLENPALAPARLDTLANAFLTPSPRARQATLDRFPGATRRRLRTRHGDIAMAEFGAGPGVLLVHGWEGAAADMLALGQRLAGAGHRVVAFDLPAHGESDGERTSPFACAEVMQALGAASGPFAAVVAHSVGAAATLEALRGGLQVGRVVLIGAPARYRDYLNAFGRAAGLDDHGTEALRAALANRGIDVAALDGPRIAAGLSQAALFIHSADDRVVPIGDARENAAAWPGARLLAFEGGGHRRVLAEERTLAASVAFLAAEGPARGD